MDRLVMQSSRRRASCLPPFRFPIQSADQGIGVKTEVTTSVLRTCQGARRPTLFRFSFFSEHNFNLTRINAFSPQEQKS